HHTGFTDAVLSNYGPSENSGTGNNISILYGNASGFTPVQPTTGGTNVSFVTVADINGDGWADVVATNGNQQGNGTFSVFRNDQAGNLILNGTFPTASNNPDCIRLADVTGDGVLDAIVSSFGKQTGPDTLTGNNITVFQGLADASGHGNFNFVTSPITTLAPAIEFSPLAVAVADFDGDGFQDIVAAVPGVPIDFGQPQPHGSVYLFKGN